MSDEQSYYDFFHSKNMVNELRLLEEGRIVAVNEESRTYTVNTTNYTVSEVPYIKNSGLLKSSGDEILSIMDRVLLYQSESKPMILFRLPEGNCDNTPHPPLSYTNVTPFSEAMREENLSNVSYRSGGAFDVLPGEFVKYGPDGGVLSVLRGPVIKLGAGSLAQMQFHKMDDLTRLVSRNVDVFTDFGEKRIYNDEGEVNVEIYGATQQFESMGSNQPGEEIGEHSPEDGKPRYRIKPYDRMGRWKIHAFAGWLGDNLRLFITRRGDSNQRLEKECSVGLAEIVVSHDGAIRLRSAREMVLEKVSRIRVPKKIREPHHNEYGDTAVEGDDRKGSGYKPSLHEYYEWDLENPAGRHLQYPEWHNHYVDHEEIRRFRDHKNDWYVESETIAKMSRTAEDIFEGQTEEDFEETSASLRIGNDGSIYAEDTWGSIFSMNSEDIILSARRDIKIQAGRDFQIFGTREGTIRTQEDLDIVSHTGTIRAKAHIDFLAAADSGNASLDSGQGNTSLISRKGDALIRSERGDVVLKSDLGNISGVAVTGELNLRSNWDAHIASDTGSVRVHGSAMSQVTSGSRVLIATGEESSQLSMNSVARDSNGKTNTSDSVDINNSTLVNPLTSYVDLTVNSTTISSKTLTSVKSENKVRVFTPESKLSISESGYVLSSSRNGTIVRQGNQEITARDSRGDSTWNKGASHSSESVVDSKAESLIMTKADIQKEGFANGRFRYKLEADRGTQIKFYTSPWNNEGSKVNITKNLTQWTDLIPVQDQEIPDVGMQRPVIGSDQFAVEDTGIEQISPYSNYVKYDDGSYNFEEKVIPGSFTGTTSIGIPTFWEEIPRTKGRLNSIPKEANGSSGGEDLSHSDFEDVINSDVNFEK